MHDLSKHELALAISREMLAIREAIGALKENESIRKPVEVESFLSYDDLKGFLNSLSKKAQRYVLSTTESEIVITRFIDWFDLDKAYEKPIGSSQDALINVLNRYLDSSLDKVKKISPIINAEMKNSRCVTYAYLQRQTSTNSAFKHKLHGATEELKLTLALMVKNDLLILCPKNTKYGDLRTNATIYKIV